MSSTAAVSALPSSGAAESCVDIRRTQANLKRIGDEGHEGADGGAVRPYCSLDQGSKVVTDGDSPEAKKPGLLNSERGTCST